MIFTNTNLVDVLISPEVYANFLGMQILKIRWSYIKGYRTVKKTVLSNVICNFERVYNKLCNWLSCDITII